MKKDYFMGEKTLSIIMIFVLGIFFSMMFIFSHTTYNVGNAYSSESYKFLKPIDQTGFKAAYVDNKSMIVKNKYSLKSNNDVLLDFIFVDEEMILYNTWYVYNSLYDSWTSFKFNSDFDYDKFTNVKDTVHLDLDEDYIFGGKVYFTFYGCISDNHKLNCDWYISDMSVVDK